MRYKYLLQQRYRSVKIHYCDVVRSIVCASVVHSTVFSLVEAIFRHLGLALSYKSTCMCPQYLYLRYYVVFCRLLQVHTRHGSQLEHESAQLLSQMLVISLRSLLAFSIINSVS